MAEVIDPQGAANMPSSTPPSPTDPTHDIQLTILHHGKPLNYDFRSDATVTDLSETISTSLSIPPTNQKYMITPKIGVLKPPFANPSLPLSTLLTKKITLLGITPAEVSTLNNTISTSQTRLRSPHPIKPSTPSRTHDFRKIQDEATYTFHTLRPLPYLPNPDRSLQFLTRLSTDAGIRAAMRTHKFSVGLLTEMDPAAHTTHESRTLGLNRNRGEVIELRLRTDAYDGYRDYKTIRKTLCHELAHNVWGEHDRNFWDLCRQIEKEVEKGDWRSGGRALTGQEFYEPSGTDEEDHVDRGGWTGGEFVLGAAPTTATGAAAGSGAGLSRRDILARAAESRMRKQNAAAKPGDHDSGSSS